MAKQSSVQITIKVDGDGVDSRHEPPAQVNATAPYAGPFLYPLIAGAGNNPLTPPAGAKGLVVAPASSNVPADLWFSYYAPPLGVPLDPTRAAYIPLVAGTTVVHLGSTLGGDVLLQWT